MSRTVLWEPDETGRRGYQPRQSRHLMPLYGLDMDRMITDAVELASNLQAGRGSIFLAAFMFSPGKHVEEDQGKPLVYSGFPGQIRL